MFLLSALLRGFLKRRQRRLVVVKDGEPTGVDLEEDVPIFIKSPKPIIFDVGANIGQSITLFKKMFPFSNIHAFEPSPICLDALMLMKDMPGVHIHPLGLGQNIGVCEMHQYELSVLNSLLPLEKNAVSNFSNVNQVGSVMVKIDTVDNMVKKLDIDRIDILKIDTQGFDLQVLHGAEQILSRGGINLVMVELNFVPLYKGQASSLNILSHMSHHGFRLIDFYEKFRSENHLGWCTALFQRE